MSIDKALYLHFLNKKPIIDKNRFFIYYTNSLKNYKKEGGKLEVFNPLSWAYIIDTMIRACWRRKNEGAYGLLLFCVKLLEVLLMVPLASIVVGVKNTYTILLLYAWFRRLDDILDHDAEPPRNCSRHQYMDYKLSLVKEINSRRGIYNDAPRYVEDMLLLQAVQITQKNNIDILTDLLRETQHLAWDYHRREVNEVNTCKRLRFQAALQDKMLFTIFIKVLRSDLVTFYRITPQLKGIFTRIDWLSDMSRDIDNKIINIPAEIMLTHHIRDNIWQHPAFIEWFNKEVETVQLEWLHLRHELKKVFLQVFNNYRFAGIICRHFICKFDSLLLSIKKIST